MGEFGNFDSADFWFPGQPHDPIGGPRTVLINGHLELVGYDRLRYVVWVEKGRGPEQAPRTAFHVHAKEAAA